MTSHSARLGAALALALFSSGCVGRPGFIPTTRHLYDRFTPLAEPRPEVPVGALWIKDYGATGDGAAPDNLVTARSLSSFTFDADFQADLTLGVLKFLDLDPSFRKKMVARFSDLSVIRIKDWSKLLGPPGEPRIYEALKAGTISITTTAAGGFDIESKLLSQDTPVVGRGTTGITRTFVIDGKDLIFAIHVASYRTVETAPTKVKVAVKPVAIALGRYRLSLRAADKAYPRGPGACVRQLAYTLQSPGQAGPGPTGTIEIDAYAGEKSIDLPVPEEGVAGALLTTVRISWNAEPKAGCATRMVEVRRTGHGIVREMKPRAPGW